MTITDAILTERRGDVLIITLNQPERLNALSFGLADRLADALADLQGARAVLLTSKGKAFCSGADLSAELEVPVPDSTYSIMCRHFNPLLLRLAEMPVPTVTAVQGAAAGIGCSLALAGDFVVAGRSASFLQAFVNIGLVPDGGASWTLTRMIGKARATEMMLLGERIPAEKAEGWGLIYKMVDDDAVLDFAFALTLRLAAGPTVALGLARRNIGAGFQGSLADALEREASTQRLAVASEDASEGVAAFMEKRKATFRGQ